jgi:RecA/RadA recombinase
MANKINTETSFLQDIVKEIGGEYASLASDINETERYVDTGSYVFNALVSGSIFGGVSGNKITAISGASSTGKTFFALAVIKDFLERHEDGYCLYFDTEAAITKSLLKSRGLDINRIIVINVVTVEEFRTKALKAVDIYMKKLKEERKPCFFVLDSLGMLSTNKEIGDALAEKDTRDMTKAALIKGAFRMLTLKLGQAEIPMIVTNHIYANVGGYGPPTSQSGGSGLLYSSSTIIELSKSKEKDGTEVIGNLIKAKTLKSRLSKENQEVQVRLFYDERGLDKYYGLLQLAEEGECIKRVGNRYEIDGKLLYEKAILKEPETYFTQELLKKIDAYAKIKFSYGSSKDGYKAEELEDVTEV